MMYGIRPEHLQIRDDGVPVEVMVIEPTGSETQIVVRPAGERPSAIIGEPEGAITCVVRERLSARPGDVIRIAPDERGIHLFDESGRRV